MEGIVEKGETAVFHNEFIQDIKPFHRPARIASTNGSAAGGMRAAARGAFYRKSGDESHSTRRI